MANFEAFRWNFLLSTNLKIGRSDYLHVILKHPFSSLKSGRHTASKQSPSAASSTIWPRPRRMHNFHFGVMSLLNLMEIQTHHTTLTLSFVFTPLGTTSAICEIENFTGQKGGGVILEIRCVFRKIHTGPNRLLY